MEKMRKLVMILIFIVLVIFCSFLSKNGIVLNKLPKLKVYSDDIIYLCPNKKENYPNYEAFDSYGNDITKKVTIEKKGVYIIYSVDDNFNKTSIKMPYKYKDIEKPTIDLSNIENRIPMGDDIDINNYEVYDNCDDNPIVTIEGGIDNKKPGRQNIKYIVKDKFGNKNEEEKEVEVYNKLIDGTIYLTFDDGPRVGTTNIILDILKQEGIKATFFVTNNGSNDLLLREKNEGHSIGLHTATHNYSYVYSSPDAYFEDLQMVHDRVYNVTGIDSKIIRFPGGSSNTISRKYYQGIMSYLTEEVQKRGYKYFDWNISSGDAGNYNTKEEIERSVISKLSKDKPNVILMHDIKTYTRDALLKIIKFGKDNGYSFGVLDEFTDMVKQTVNN